MHNTFSCSCTAFPLDFVSTPFTLKNLAAPNSNPPPLCSVAYTPTLYPVRKIGGIIHSFSTYPPMRGEKVLTFLRTHRVIT